MRVGGDGSGGEDVVDGSGPGGALAGGEGGGSGRRDQAVPGGEWAHGSERGGQGGARGACAVEVTQEDAQVWTHAGAEVVHELDLDTHSEYKRRGRRWALNRRAWPPSERGPAEAIQCGPL